MDRNTILKQMGIVQWVLRDEQSDLSVPHRPATQEAEPKPQHTASRVKPAGTVSVQPVVGARVVDTPRKVGSEGTLDALRQQVAECVFCDLAQSRNHTVFGEGPGQADWLFVGEAPGQQEDRQGKPFVGRAGGLLTQMVHALDKSREKVYITNTLKCRPPNNRDPLPAELSACESYLLNQIELVRPKVMVALGRISAQALLKTDQPLGQLRGRVHQYGPNQISLIVTYHPAYLLRQPAEKGKVWADLLLAHRQIPV